MKIEVINKKIVRINNVVYNLALNEDFKQAKKILSEKDFNSLIEKKKEIQVVNKDYVVDMIEKKSTKKKK